MPAAPARASKDSKIRIGIDIKPTCLELALVDMTSDYVFVLLTSPV